MLKRLIGVGVSIGLLLLIGVGWTAWNKYQEKEDAPDVGECITVSGPAADVEVDEAECGGDDVLYKVTADDGDCDPNEVSYTVSIDGSDAVNLCLFYSVEEGDCIKIGVDRDEKIECSEAKNDGNYAEVVAVHDTADEKCGKTDFAFVNEKRDELICLGPIA